MVGSWADDEGWYVCNDEAKTKALTEDPIPHAPDMEALIQELLEIAAS